MLLEKTGFPQEDELVICTITNVQHHSVFCRLDEYNRQGMIHISEVSPGRIRNIRDFVEEGKKVVCKVLRINPEKGHIDLSLRRVNEGQKRLKIDEVKQEQKAEKILEFVCEKLKKNPKTTFIQIKNKVFENYPNLYLCFQDMVIGTITIDFLGLDKDLSEELDKTIKTRIKVPEVQIGGVMSIKLYTPNGVDTIKEALQKVAHKDVTVRYLGAGKYDIDVKAPNYKEAEKALKKITESVIEMIEKNKGEASFEKQEKK